MRNHALRSSIGDVGGGGGGGGGLDPIELIHSENDYTTFNDKTLPAHNDGDIIILATTNKTSTAPTVLTGYTSIIVVEIYGAAYGWRSMRVQYIVSDGTISTIAAGSPNYGSYYIFRNAAIGNTAGSTGSTSSVTTHVFEAISPLSVTDGTSWVIGIDYFKLSTIAPTGMIYTPGTGYSAAAHVEEVSAFADHPFTTGSTQTAPTHCSIELTRL